MAAAVLCGLVAVPACGEKTVDGGDARFEPTLPTLLSVGSPTKDEDPSVVRARDGSVFVAWFSDRGGNPDLYITSTARRTEWGPAIRITTSADGDFYPNLLQDDRGTFHLTWFRWNAPFRGHIWYNSSNDGISWNQNTEVQVTAAPNVDDRVPTLGQAMDGTLLIYFVSDTRDLANPTSEIYVTSRRPGQATWSFPVPANGLNSATEHDQLPVGANGRPARSRLGASRHD